MLRIGVDAGGTNTDCVVVRGERIVAQCKSPTMPDVGEGVRASIATCVGLLSERDRALQVGQVMLGTTHFVNALVQRQGLARVAVLRLGGHVACSVPPFADWPEDLASMVNGFVGMIRGGYEFDGRELGSLDEEHLRECCAEIRAQGIRTVAISCVYSSVCSAQEKRAAEVVRQELGPDAYVSCGSELGRLGLCERENTVIINAALRELAEKTISSFETGLGDVLGPQAVTRPEMFLTQNDGTLMPLGLARVLPVLTFASGPTNSMRGAAFLTGFRDAVVVDVGGTTSDAGLLSKGFPLERALDARIGGVRTNFRLPDVHSIGLGGGSRIHEHDDGSVTVGPDSVGYRLLEEAIIFGGSTLTTSDIAVAAGLCEMGNPELVRSGPLAPSERIVRLALKEIQRLMVELVEQLRPNAEKIPLLLVGGGQVIVPPTISIRSVSQILRPRFHGVVNAFGAAIGQVSIERETAEVIMPGQRNLVIARMEEELREELLHMEPNLDRSSLQVVDVRDVAMPYVQNVYNVHMKLVADLRMGGDKEEEEEDLERGGEEPPLIVQADPLRSEGASAPPVGPGGAETSPMHSGNSGDKQQHAEDPFSLQASDLEAVVAVVPDVSGEEEKEAASSLSHAADDGAALDILTAAYPLTFDEDGAWLLNERDVAFMSFGCTLLGAGGGGRCNPSSVRARLLLAQGKKIRLVDLSMLPEDSLVVPVAFLGAPSVLAEKISSGAECSDALQSLLAFNWSPSRGSGGEMEALADALMQRKAQRAKEGAGGGGSRSASAQHQQHRPPRGVIRALVSAEIGGMNGLEPLVTAADMGLPVVDADGMGRAFPELHMFIPYLNGLSGVPCAMSNHQGDTVVVTSVNTNHILEQIMRCNSINFGCNGGIAMCPLSMDTMRHHMVHSSYSLAWRLGATMHHAHSCKLNTSGPLSLLASTLQGRTLYSGKIVSVERVIKRGFSTGFVLLGPLSAAPLKPGEETPVEDLLRLVFKNENLLAQHVRGAPQGSPPPNAATMENLELVEVCAATPDLLCVVETETGYPIVCEDLAFGQRASVLAFPSPTFFREEHALRVVGPEAFGLKGITYQPLPTDYVLGPSVFARRRK